MCVCVCVYMRVYMHMLLLLIFLGCFKKTPEQCLTIEMNIYFQPLLAVDTYLLTHNTDQLMSKSFFFLFKGAICSTDTNRYYIPNSKYWRAPYPHFPRLKTHMGCADLGH